MADRQAQNRPDKAAGPAQGPALPPQPGRSDGSVDQQKGDNVRRWPWLLGAIAILLIAAGTFAWLALSGEQPAQATPPPPLIETATARSATRITISQTAFVRPLADVVVAAEINGRIEEVAEDFKRGNFVSEGDVLLRLETRQIRADVSRAEADVARAEAAAAEARLERDRQQELEQREFASEAALQQAIVGLASAEADLTAARAQLVASRTRLEDATITAPFDALVLEVEADPGDIVQVGATLGHLVASDAVELELGLTASALSLLGKAERAIGGRVLVRTAGQVSDMGDNLRATGVVTQVGPGIDPETRTVPLIVRVENPFRQDGDRPPLRLDELVLLELPVDLTERDMVSIPNRAIKGDDVVWVAISDGKEDSTRLQQVAVRIVQRTAERAVVEGINDGARVMTSDFSGAADGVSVRLAASRGLDGNDTQADSGESP